jgi:SAM-dependent methyltransferase
MDQKKFMNCRICNATTNEKPLKIKEMMFGTGKIYSYLQCSSCGCLQIEEAERNIENMYPREYYSFNTYNIGGLIKNLKQLVTRCSVGSALGNKSLINLFFAKNGRAAGANALKGRISTNMTILDVGCGDGSLIDALNWNGYENLIGIDPYLNENLIRKDFKLLKKDISELEGCEIFDVIMLHHSFEHVENPSEVLCHIRKLLKRDGVCIIRIPVSDSYAFETYKENWVQIDAPRHFFLHTNRSMDILTSKNKLKIESIVDDSSEFQFIGSEQYKKGIALKDPKSYFISFYKKAIFNKKHLFSYSDIKKFKDQAEALNKAEKGDQRIYYIKHLNA